MNISQERVHKTAKSEHEPAIVSRAEEAYEAAKQREWVGLTKDEVNDWELPDCPTVFEFAQFIEAKLKEKNNG